LLDRQIGWFGALQNPSGVNADLATDSCDINSIADQAAGRGEPSILVDRRYGIA